MPIRDTGNEAETIISSSVKVEGDFVSQGNVLIEGTVEGSLKTERNLRVGEKARIDADVSAANATVAGEVRGNIVISEKLELEPTAKVQGDVRAKILVVAAGAEINGRLAMGAEAVAEKPAKNGIAAKIAAKAAEKAATAEEKAVEPASTFFGK